MIKYHTPLNCQMFHFFGLANYGQKFNSIDLDSSPKASIKIPANTACKNNQSVPMYFVGYQSNKLFLPIQLKPKNSQNSLFLAKKPNRKTKSYENFEQMEYNKCKIDHHYAHRPIFTAVIVKNNNGSGSFIKTNRKLMAKIRYEIGDVKF